MTKAQFRLLYSAMIVVAVGTAAHAAAAQSNRPASQSGVDRLLRREADEQQLSQFQLPGRTPGAPAAPGATPAAAPSKDLRFEYVYGHETEFVWRKNNDLDRNLRDNFATVAPTMFGMVTYRPNDWLETRVEGTLERVFPLREEEIVVDPTGAETPHDKQELTLLLDQIYLKVKPPGVPAEVTVGRRDFGDWRLWLYDGSLDGVHVATKAGDFAFEASLTRGDFKELDLLQHPPRGRTTNYILHAEYRGIEDHRFAAYYIYRRDSDPFDANAETGGRPEWSGVRAIGRPSDSFNYWADLGQVRGSAMDQNDVPETLRGWAWEVGGTYRFLNLPWQPNVTLNYAYGSGDDHSGDGRDHAYRQTGFHSNEQRFGGVTQFKYYGEFLDPELSNLTIYTAGVGARPLANMWVDLVYHKYHFNQVDPNDNGPTFRGGQGSISTLPNLGVTQSHDVGQEIDVIVGFRNLFGVRGLGFEVRTGLFLPGDAFHKANDDKGDPGFSMLAAIFL
jgi:alginate production protein